MSGGWPWIYSYLPEPHSARSAPRPALQMDVLGRDEPWRVWALVDSGSEFTLAARWVQQAIAVDPDPATEIEVRIGGALRRVQFAVARLRLFSPTGEHCDEWDATVGFFQQEWQPFWSMVLGRQGFFDRYTVTLHGHAEFLAVEPYEVFDQRFNTRYLRNG